MGMDMTYIAEKEEFSFGLSPTDVDIMKCLEKKGLKKEVEAIFGVSDFDKESSVGRVLLLEAVDVLLKAVNKDPKILPYTYIIKVEMPPDSGQYSSGTGMISGIRIKGELYSIVNGLDKCDLTRMFKDKSGKWYDDKPKDIRNFKSIKTDNMGEIIIRKRRKPTCLVGNLNKLKKFLEKTDVEIVQKVLG